MRKLLPLLLSVFACHCAEAQATFKAGWNTYKTSLIIREYTYNYSSKDSVRLYITDSTITYATADSSVTMTVDYPVHEKSVFKTVDYFNPKKQLIKQEEYKGEELLVSSEWKYDEKGRKSYHYEDNRSKGSNIRQNYDYSNEKNGDVIITESQYYNGKIEYYTKYYYDKKSVKYKEVRLNDNNKDVIHIESYTYGENGKVKERSVYFPEFKVTKKFDERGGYELPKCFRSLPMGTAEKVNIHTRISFIKKLLARVQPILADKECEEFEYKFSNYTNCEIIVSSTKMTNLRQLVFRYKERVQ